MCESHNITFKVFNALDPDVVLPPADTTDMKSKCAAGSKHYIGSRAEWTGIWKREEKSI